MSKKNLLKQNDGRSQRSSRMSAQIEFAMRTFTRFPREDADLSAVTSMPLDKLMHQLQEFYYEVISVLGRPVKLHPETFCYGAFADTLAEPRSKALLHPGVYIIHEVARPNRVLYIGSATDTAVRHRIVNHLCFDGNKRGLLENIYGGIREALDAVESSRTAEEIDNRIRTIAFANNRWTLSKTGTCCTPEMLQALTAIETGAFNLSVLRLEEPECALACVLELYLHRVSQRFGHSLPPLNSFEARDPTGLLAGKLRGDLDSADVIQLLEALLGKAKHN